MKLFIRTILLVAAATLAFAGSKVSPDTPASTPNGMVDVIIQFKSAPSKDALKQLGPYGQIKKQFVHINAVNVVVPVSAINAIASNPEVKYISPNRKSTSTLDIVTQTVNATLAWASGWDGTGIGVAIVDSGVWPKADLGTKDTLSSRIVYSESFVAGLDASDQYGHGTHVAGIVAANGLASSGPAFTRTFKGVAPNANIVNLRVLDANGGGQEADVISAVDRAIQLKSAYNIRVLNLSLGHPIYESYTLDPLCQELEAAWNAGIVVVTAAGNYGRDNSMHTKGYGTIVSPGNDPYVITVGAMKTNGTPYRTDDSIASYSSKGPTLIDHIAKPDLVAPGNGVVSLMAPGCTLATQFPRTMVSNAAYETVGLVQPGKSGDYFRLSGTSMATPVVSGAAALMLQKQPSLTPDQVKARLMKTATKALPLYSTGIDAVNLFSFSSQSDIFTVGAGYLDINGALNNTDLVTLPAMSPTAVYDPVTKKVTIVVNQVIIWGDVIVWGDTLIWGTNVLVNATGLIWGDAITWGDDSDPGFAIIWGSTISANTTLQASDVDDGDQDPTLTY